MKLVAKYYTIYTYDMGYFIPSDWHYQSLALAEKEIEEENEKEDWIINEVKIWFHDNGGVTVEEETVLEKGE